MKLVNTDDTLVIVTADHAHTMSIGGYTGRFHDITGVVEDPMGDGYDEGAADGDTLTILSYGKKCSPDCLTPHTVLQVTGPALRS